MTNRRVFGIAFVLGLVLALANALYVRHENRQKEFKPIEAGVFLSEQIAARDFRQIRRAGIKTIIDMRPDGEAVDQMPSADVAKTCKVSHIDFVYNPVPHGEIPESAVQNLERVLRESPRPILMYCRTGRRAVRTYCLVEASATPGPGKDSPLSLAKESGFDADDLSADIAARIAKRKEK